MLFDVSTYKVINNSCISCHTVVLDGDDNNNFIFVKIAKTQSNKCMGGRKGLNTIRMTLSTMKKKPKMWKKCNGFLNIIQIIWS